MASSNLLRHLETYNSASKNESSESDEEIEIPSAKRRQTVPYTFMKSFSSTNETLEEVHKNEEWSHRATKPTAEGRKVFFGCRASKFIRGHIQQPNF